MTTNMVRMVWVDFIKVVNYALTIDNPLACIFHDYILIFFLENDERSF